MRKFLVIAAARTGSTLLMQVLESSPDVKIQFELFHKNSIQVDGEDWSHDIPRRDSAPMAWLDEIWARSDKPVAGFKIFPHQNDDVRDALIADSNVDKIVLYRENFLAVYSSLMISMATNRWSEPITQNVDLKSIDAAKHTWTFRTKFDEEDFVRRHRQYLKFYRDSVEKLNAENQEFQFIEYGELLNEGLMRRLFPFLGARQPEAIKVGMEKNNSSHIVARFSNPDEVREYLNRVRKRDWVSESFTSW